MTTTSTTPVKTRGHNHQSSPASPYHRTSDDPMFGARRKSHVYRRFIKRAIQSAVNLKAAPLNAAQRGACHFFADTYTSDSRR